jgi:hypothetical protein
MNELHKAFMDYIVHELNPLLIKRFGTNAKAVEYMHQNGLLDVKSDGSESGFCYSTLRVQ